MQDDTEDWTEAVATMADIYENAFITIAASWSSDSNGGCFSSMRDIYKERSLGDTGLSCRRDLPPFAQYRHSISQDDTFKDWPLLTRGWVRDTGKKHLLGNR
jgi:hypothetical protein